MNTYAQTYAQITLGFRQLNSLSKGWARAYTVANSSTDESSYCYFYVDSCGGYHNFRHILTCKTIAITAMDSDWDIDFDIYNGFKKPKSFPRNPVKSLL